MATSSKNTENSVVRDLTDIKHDLSIQQAIASIEKLEDKLDQLWTYTYRDINGKVQVIEANISDKNNYFRDQNNKLKTEIVARIDRSEDTVFEYATDVKDTAAYQLTLFMYFGSGLLTLFLAGTTIIQSYYRKRELKILKETANKLHNNVDFIDKLAKDSDLLAHLSQSLYNNEGFISKLATNPNLIDQLVEKLSEGDHIAQYISSSSALMYQIRSMILDAVYNIDPETNPETNPEAVNVIYEAFHEQTKRKDKLNNLIDPEKETEN